MIPCRIALTGFLCYRDEQVIEFEGSDLWVFSGRNGSGKSAVFDAMTFALFGYHRGGKQDAASLIHADASEMSVVFDFDLGPVRYRIKRSLRRGSSTERQLFRFEPGDDGPGRWPAVPETNRPEGLRLWVQENVGLTYETFTASVLLMQGQAERLLGAQPKERFTVLAGIVDLARYERLHKRADQRRQRNKGLAEGLRNQLRDLPEIEPAAIEEAERLLIQAQDEHGAVENEWKRLREVERLADLWKGLTARRDVACTDRDHAQRLLDDSGAIARDWGRLQELDAVLPGLLEALERRGRLREAEAELKQLDQEGSALRRKLDLMAGLAEDNRAHLASIVEEIGRDERRRREILERTVALAAPIQRVATARTHRAEVARLERALADYPDDLEATTALLENDHRCCLEWKQALPVLSGLARARDKLAKVHAQVAEADRAIEAGTADVARLTDAQTLHRAEQRTALEHERETRDRLTESATLHRAATNRLDQLEGLRGAPACDRCGQRLTAEHFEAEAVRLRAERDQAARSFERVRSAHDEAKAAYAKFETAGDELDRSLRDAASAVDRARQARSQADQEARTRVADCEAAYANLGEPFRSRVATSPPGDWLATVFPTGDDLAKGRLYVDGIAELESASAALRARCQEMQRHRGLREQALRALDAVGLVPADEAAEAEHAALSAETAVLARCLEGHEKEKELASATLARLDELVRSVNRRWNEVDKNVTSDRTRIQAWTEELTRARLSVSEAWLGMFDSADAPQIDVLDGERQAIRDQGTEAQAAELPLARRRLDEAETDIALLDAQLAKVPPEAQRDPVEVTAARTDAEDMLRKAAATCTVRQRELDQLCHHRDHRQRVAAQALEAEQAESVAKTLVQLLGREGLQRHLLRESERGIIDCANPILREVSGGELELRLLEGKEADQALAMQAVVRTHGRTRVHDVEYLSGSQRFRVAVSLALGIGQYARGIQRPIESVIIDEGFGSLDRQGRDEMIEELRSLKGRLARIILVSHQEEFADAFNDGYRFEIVEGATVVQPLHR